MSVIVGTYVAVSKKINCPLRQRGQGHVTHWKVKDQGHKNAETVLGDNLDYNPIYLK